MQYRGRNWGTDRIPDEVIASAAIALSIEVGAVLEIPLVGKILAGMGMVGIGVMIYRLRNEMAWINNDPERIQALAKYITKIIILAVVAISGVKAADVIAKQFTYPVMWSKAIDVVHENRIIRWLNDAEHYIDDIMTELYYSFSTALCSVDDIYAKLAAMVDDDALAYLQREYGTPSQNRIKAFYDIVDNIKIAKKITGRKLEQSEVKFIHRSMLNGAPAKLIEHFVKDHYGQSTEKIGDLTNLQGSTIDEILSRIPYDSEYKKFTPKAGGAQEGFKFQWKGSDGRTYRLEVHDEDPSAPVGSNAASGWVVRVKKGQRYLDYTINDYQEAKYTNQNGSDHDEVIINNTHIPIKNPYGEK